MARIHVLQIIDGLNLGGAEMLLYNLIQGLPQNRFRVSLAYSTPGPLIERIAALDVPMTRLPRLARVDPLLFWNMYRAIHRDPPDIVHTHLFKSDFHGRPAARLAGVPVVVSALQNCGEWAKNPVYGRVYGQTIRFVDMLIAASEEVRQFAIRYMAAPANKIITIDNAVPIERFIGNEEAGLALRAELGISVHAPLIGIVARLVPQKDHATFLKAAVIIKQAIPDMRFLVVGDGPLRDETMALAGSLGLEQAVIFAGIRQDIPAVMAALDLLMFSSRWEGLPVALLEGMASGKAVVATAVDGIPGVVLEGETGLLAERGNADALAAAAITILRDPDLARSMGQAGRKRTEEHYSNRAAIRRTAELYEQLLMRHRHRQALMGISR